MKFLIIILGFGLVFLRALAGFLAYNWFIGPEFKIQLITYWQVFAVLIVFMTITFKIDKNFLEEKTNEEKEKQELKDLKLIG